MQASARTLAVSPKALWAGRILTALPSLFLLMSGVIKFIQPEAAADSMKVLAYPASLLITLGILELGSLLLYLVPRTAVLGAILLTGYLGGAVAVHLRVGDTFFNTIMPALLGVMIWGGLFFRDERLRALLPLRK